MPARPQHDPVPRPVRSAPVRQHGFTLIEMLVVIAILGVALGLVASRGAWHSTTVDVRAAADAVASALRTTRAMALRTDARATCVIDPVRRLVRPVHGAPVRIPGRVAMSAAIVAFGPDGAGTGGLVRLSEGGSHREVRIDWLSGRIAVTAPAEVTALAEKP